MHGHISQQPTNEDDPTGEFLGSAFSQTRVIARPTSPRPVHVTPSALVPRVPAHSRICSDLVLRQIEELHHVARALRQAFCKPDILGSLRGIAGSRHTYGMNPLACMNHS